MSKSGTYRPELDGLRAIAVLAVLLYHVDVPWIPGGFVGVDVFFVLSGFLITGLLRRGLVEGGAFRYREFFVRRVRRLSPALLFLTLCSFVAAWFILLPRTMASFAGSVWVQPIALQNMHFLVEGEYFNGSNGKPLLHTWSLGVEEQFYLVWPFILVFLSSRGRRWTLGGLGLVALGSYALCLVLPALSPKAAFFLFPARAWELAVGGILAVVQESGAGRPRSQAVGSALVAVSLAVLGFSFFWIDESMRFPGWVALLPCIGSLGLIAGTTGTHGPLKRLLSTGPMVYIGKISYSLYLWHWPVIVFARHLGHEPGEPLNAAILLTLSVVLAAASHRLVEEPIRRRRILGTTKQLLVAVGVTSVLLMAAAATALETHGLSYRYDEPARSMLTASFHADGDDRCGFLFRLMEPTSPACVANDVEPGANGGVLLWGNSHASMWVAVLGDLGEEHQRPVYLTARNCRATTDSGFCGPHLQDSTLAMVEERGITDVVLASTWYGAYDRPDSDFEEELEGVVARLSEAGVRTWLVVDIQIDPAFDPEERYDAQPDSPSFGSVPYDPEVAARVARERALFERLAAEYSGVGILDPNPALCPGLASCLGGQGNEAWYRDDEHVTNAGAVRAREQFTPIFAAD